MTAQNSAGALGAPQPTRAHPSSTDKASVAEAQHSEPTVTLYGRIAAGPIGYVSWPDPPDLHFSIIIDDAYDGITVLDGQPTMMEAGIRNMALIRTNRYDNALPSGARVKIALQPPQGMSRREFAHRITVNSQKFVSYVAPYSAPKNIRGSQMRAGEYNSSSYVAGLLQSVMGHAPEISAPGFQTPGWENPIPGHFFKGEAIR
ncbi:hypothetical protein [Variovorax sp. 770b2]|uniref:hypothetical protein n=1 Tax=Variovorax sp. 770b2 TaxID=1566271 RepID=UPI0008EAE8D2|nr:hypothetical protein [Variovorax sp. 770b2]SFQ13684.1 hypothetical protein SAMN03159339_5747 [Variovorax sp. 770b2]